MSAEDIGGRLRAARWAAGLTQLELAERMCTGSSVICRVETGRVSPTTEFIERYAQGLGTRIDLSFGLPQVVRPEERFRRAWQAFRGLVYRHGRYFPPAADQILRTRTDVDPADLYVEMLERVGSAVDQDWRFREWSEPREVRGPTAVAAMYYEVVDWPAVRRRLMPTMRRLDTKIRRRAREILADRRRLDLSVQTGEWVGRVTPDGDGGPMRHVGS